MSKITAIFDFFRKIPAAFLVAIVTVLGLMLFLPEQTAKDLAVDIFREKYRVYLGPAFLLSVAFCVARVFNFFSNIVLVKRRLKKQQKVLHSLTSEEKGYLVPFIIHGQNSVNVGMDDGVMTGLRVKGIVYVPGSMGSVLDGFAFNLQPWAREYLSNKKHLLDGYAGRPLTPSERMGFRC